MKSEVLTVHAELLPIPVWFLVFYGLHVMIEGVHFRIPPYFCGPDNHPCLYFSIVIRYGFSCCFCNDLDSQVPGNLLKLFFHHPSHVREYRVNLCFAKIFDGLFSNLAYFVLKILVKPGIFIQKLEGHIDSWFLCVFCLFNFHPKSNRKSKCISFSCCYKSFPCMGKEKPLQISFSCYYNSFPKRV